MLSIEGESLDMIHGGLSELGHLDQISSSRVNMQNRAKPQTKEKVCSIVKRQLVLGADSSVEIVMGLVEEFGINVEEESAKSTTIQDVANLIETLLEKPT
ncbi:hypothetical protein UlMin_023238 [Ulmus minor]